MDVKVISGDIKEIKCDAIVLGYTENSESLSGEIALLDEITEGEISRLIKSGEIKGKYKELSVIYSSGRLNAAKAVIAGLGKANESSLERMRVIAAEACKLLRKRGNGSTDVALILDSFVGINVEDVAQAVTEGAILGAYSFRKYMTKPSEEKSIRTLYIVVKDQNSFNAVSERCEKGRIIAEAACLARDMVNEPSNYMTPTDVSEKAVEVANKYKLTVEVLEQDVMLKLGMGGMLGVSQGSQQPPKFIIMGYKGKQSDNIDIALVGKGITFDSGGISIKPSENMGDMKGDMAGGASVIASMSAVAQLKPEINVIAIIPATENLPSGTAMKPGDIIKIMNGTTVEIISTDAEGRLILADAVCYARKLGAKAIVDVATLTGACSIALGEVCTGSFANNQELQNKILQAGKETGECIWPMPMNDEYKELNKSDVADIKNSGGRYGGAITAALFVGEFAGNTPWVHLDIAGTSDTKKEHGYILKGGTGIPVRTLINFIMNYSG